MSKTKDKKDKETPSILAFERKLEPSDALFFSGNWAECDDASKWSPVVLQEKTVRGTVVHRLPPTEKDPARLNLNIEEPNIQTVHSLSLPVEHDTLRVQFTLRVRGGLGEPSACNKIEYRNKLKSIVDFYVERHGLKELSLRYAMNLANGRFLWRNYDSAEEIKVCIESLKGGELGQQWCFDINPFSESSKERMTCGSNSEELSALSDLIARGLLRKEYVLLRTTAFARVGAGQEVFPSQEFIQKPEGGWRNGDRTKTLYQVKSIAAMHSQKIGNALRTIDTWYEDSHKNGPIAVESYGSVTSQGQAWRQPTKNQDFYSILDDWVIKGLVPPLEQQHYVIAMLIRGGVFGEAEEKKQKKAKGE